MSRVLTASSCLFEPCSVFEIFRCCRPKERSLGLGGTAFGPTFSSDLSLPAGKTEGQVLPVPISQPAKLAWRGVAVLQPMGKGPGVPPPHPCGPRDPWPRPFTGPPDFPRLPAWTVEMPTASPQWCHPHISGYYCLESNLKPSCC